MAYRYPKSEINKHTGLSVSKLLIFLSFVTAGFLILVAGTRLIRHLMDLWTYGSGLGSIIFLLLAGTLLSLEEGKWGTACLCIFVLIAIVAISAWMVANTW
jgi:hypothetical protein